MFIFYKRMCGIVCVIVCFLHVVHVVDNVLAVRLDCNYRWEIPPGNIESQGSWPDYLLFSGIYRDVWLICTDNVYIPSYGQQISDLLGLNYNLSTSLSNMRIYNAEYDEGWVKWGFRGDTNTANDVSLEGSLSAGTYIGCDNEQELSCLLGEDYFVLRGVMV